MKFEIMKNIDIFKSYYNEKHRFYHTFSHVENIIYCINNLNYTEEQRNILYYSALFHDIVYNPKNSNNEEKSIEFFINYIQENNIKIKESSKKQIIQIILDTKNGIGENKLSKDFQSFDRAILYSSFKDLLQYEKLIMKEYQYLDYSIYKKNRIKFLSSFVSDNLEISKLIIYIENYLPNIGIYAGSFNPFHLGHYDILCKAEKIFDKVIVAYGLNPNKKNNNNYNIDLPFHQVDVFYGLLVDYIKSKKEANYCLIKGLRNGYDLDYEFNQLRWMEELANEKINIVYFPSCLEFSYISSSNIRDLNYFDKGESYIFKWDKL
jgi:pantetheine-phosphate adenylyltransferase